MSSGLLQFTLGLGTAGFISNLEKADSKLKGFIAGTIGLAASIEGVQNQIEKGAGLKRLSDQTGDSISNLYKIQRALHAVGADSEAAGNLIFTLGKSLGGVNEQGVPTAFAFNQIGLSIDELKKLDAPGQLLAVANGLNRLDAASRSGIAARIFAHAGSEEGGAREFLQLASNADEFAEALKRSGVQAAIFDRYGRTFEKIETLTGELKENFSSIFLGIAAGIGPALENILQMMNGIDLSKIGATIGTFITALTQAFREGKFSELIGDSLKLGFDTLLAYAPALFEKVGYFLIKAFETPLMYIQAGMQFALESAGDLAFKALMNNKLVQFLLATHPAALGALAGAATLAGGGQSFADILAERKKDGLKFNLGSGEFGPDEINRDANDRFHSAAASMKEKWKNFGAELFDFASRAPQPDAARKTAKQQQALQATYVPAFSALEKMGFVFRGGGDHGDPASQTARNTKEIADGIKKLVGMAQSPARGTYGDPLLSPYGS